METGMSKVRMDITIDHGSQKPQILHVQNTPEQMTGTRDWVFIKIWLRNVIPTQEKAWESRCPDSKTGKPTWGWGSKNKNYGTSGAETWKSPGTIMYPCKWPEKIDFRPGPVQRSLQTSQFHNDSIPCSNMRNPNERNYSSRMFGTR